MKKILVLNYEFPPSSAVALAKADGGGASPVSYEIAERLSKFPLHSDIPPSFLRRGLGVVLPRRRESNRRPLLILTL
jgi:hypothetical protein